MVESGPSKLCGRVLARHALPVPEPLGPFVRVLTPQLVAGTAGPTAPLDAGWLRLPPVTQSLGPADLPLARHCACSLPRTTHFTAEAQGVLLKGEQLGSSEAAFMPSSVPPQSPGSHSSPTAFITI